MPSVCPARTPEGREDEMDRRSLFDKVDISADSVGVASTLSQCEVMAYQTLRNPSSDADTITLVELSSAKHTPLTARRQDSDGSVYGQTQKKGPRRHGAASTHHHFHVQKR